MNIVEATRRHEAWLKTITPLNQKHLALKHSLMKEGIFAFLRATFYRWTQIWSEVCPDLRAAPKVLAIGDIHIENFGTWRDSEGRLIWGVNDFDEAYPLPYMNDLVRLATSAELAIAENRLALRLKEACEAILSGYLEGLKAGGEPFVLEEDHQKLRAMAFNSERNPRRFWQKLMEREKTKGTIPASVSKIFDEVMPKSRLPYQLLSRVSGLGSLGRFRVVAIADWSGGKIAREVKALAPSAHVWAQNLSGQHTIYYPSMLAKVVRAQDPFVSVKGSWIARRLSPHCCRIEMDELPKKRDEYRLLRAMGWETANIHLGSRGRVSAIQRDLTKRPDGWLHNAALAMAKATTRDWNEWKKT